ncbi:hypothetical protein H5407_23300 [Mitsuaria sp. WAJ17]|nr:hypothetical protein [Mitsuaria sp. WAJ17]MBB2488165.1 hypothetical protein [Mitsuaria sp. WAJ17]
MWSTTSGGSRPASSAAYVYLGEKATAELDSVSGPVLTQQNLLRSCR